jgi:hypothetical protein
MAKLKLGERIITALGGATTNDVRVAANRAYADGFNTGQQIRQVRRRRFENYDPMGGNDDPASGGIAAGGFGYRQTGQGQGRESDISPEQNHKTAWALNQMNPVAKRGLDIKRDYIIGRGSQPQASDEKLQEILDAFWGHNQMNRRASEFTRQLQLFGEQCYPVFVRESDGAVTLAYIDPGEIERVITDPDNVLDLWAVVVRPQQQLDKWAKQSESARVYRIVREVGDNRHGYETNTLVTCGHAEAYGVIQDWEREMLTEYGLDAYTGSCFYERINAVSNQTRGLSALVPVADWLDQGDEVLFALGDREQMAGYFSWDVTLDGASEDDVKARAKEIAIDPPHKGSAKVHNEKENWEFIFPDLKAASSVESYKALATQAWGGLGFPNSWYGSGDETNRATAQAQGDPTWKSLQHDQGIVEDMLTRMLEFVRDQAKLAGTYRPREDDDQTVTMPMPAMVTKDVVGISGALATLTSALSVAQDAGWILPEDAAEAFAIVLSELGVEVDTSREIVAPSPGALIGGELGAAPDKTNKNSWFEVHERLEEK